MAVSPWSGAGLSAAAAGWAAILFLIVNEAISCALGGYLAGRLRTKWVAVHTDEVYFRDTANGFLVWAVAVVITAVYLVSSAAAMVGKPGPAAGESKASVDPRAYYVDRLFRSETVGLPRIDASVEAEATRILTVVLERPESSSADMSYRSRLVAAKTGLNETAAGSRVSEVVTEARQAEDTARQSASHLLLWTFVALLTGAFCASVAATIGGRQRDHVPVV
jgi:hypothetical protein